MNRGIVLYVRNVIPRFSLYSYNESYRFCRNIEYPELDRASFGLSRSERTRYERTIDPRREWI